MTLATFKHYLGESASQEIWMRSDNGALSEYKCPGCRNEMRVVNEPQWVGRFTIDVCRACWLVWLDHGEHPEIPHGSDIDLKVEAIKQKAAQIETTYLNDFMKTPSAEPDSIVHMLTGLFLPTKTITRGLPIITLLMMLAMILGYTTFNTGAINDRIFFGFNLYFFYLFSSDLEVELNKTAYFLTLILAFTLPILMFHYSTLQQLPFGLPPINICLMAMAIFLPLNAKFSYLFPAVHYFRIPEQGYTARISGLRWIHFPQWATILFYLVIFIPTYFMFRESSIHTPMKIILMAELMLGILLGVIYAQAEKLNK